MRIPVQKIPQKIHEFDSDDVLAKFCYYFPQYTLAEAKKIPYKRIQQMLRVVKREQAIQMYDLVQVIAAPHTKDGTAVTELLQYYKEIIEK